MNRQRVCVAGIGNELRGDDGLGLAAARAIAQRDLPGVDVIELRDDLTPLIEAWRGASAAYLVDAVRSGREAGRLLRIDLGRDGLPREISLSSHGLGLRQTIDTAHELESQPPTVVLYGIEGERFELGEAPSAAGLAAVAELVERVVAEIDALARQGQRSRA